MTAFDRACDIVKSVYHRVFSDEELQQIANDNQQLLQFQEPLDADPSVNWPSECQQCFTPINNMVEGIPNMCSRCIHPWVEKRLDDALEASGMFGAGIVDTEIDYRKYRDKMGDLA